MSQAGIVSTSGGPPPPDVPTTFVEDSGSATAAANILNVLGTNGISTSGSGNTVTISVQNGVTNTGQTINVQTIDLTTIDCSIAGTYFIESRIAGYTAGNLGAGLSLYTTVISNGAAATILDDTDSINHISAALNTSDLDYEFVGSGTNAILQITGVSGQTINWGAFSVYIYRGL
jgi:hypothetical protein